jgi:hypothetical protein
MADEVFAVFGDGPRSFTTALNGSSLPARFHSYSDVVVTPQELTVMSTNAKHATDEQWTAKGATCRYDAGCRSHTARPPPIVKRDDAAPSLTQLAVLVTKRTAHLN